MFWLPKSNLPCLFYDSPDMKKVEFTVLPVCCTTYHYAVKVSYNTIEPLTVQKLKSCTDERTHDFTLALMDFAEWDIKKAWNSDNSSSPTSNEDNDDDENRLYLWPDFILDMINSPREWAAWRKRVERNSGGSRITRKSLYLSALCEGFRLELQKESSPGSEGSATQTDADAGADDDDDDDDERTGAAATVSGKREREAVGAEVGGDVSAAAKRAGAPDLFEYKRW